MFGSKSTKEEKPEKSKPSGGGGLFDEEDDDLFSTPSPKKAESKPTAKHKGTVMIQYII